MPASSKYLPIDSLRLWDKNPRSITRDAYNSLKNKIQRWGQFKPVICTPDGEVIGGNMRLRAYQELGIKDIWVSVVEPKNEAEKLEIAITDNEASGRWQEEQLAEYLEQYKGEIDLGNYQVDLGNPVSLDELLSKYGPEPEEDEVPQVQEEAVSKLGEVYQLGRHRIMCGDSTKIEDVEKLMGGKKADMVFTDPPYGVGYTNNKQVNGHEYKRESTYETLENDDLTPDEFKQFMCEVITNMNLALKDNAVIYLCTSDKPDFRQAYENACKDNGFNYSAYLVWDKGNFGFGFQNYRAEHEGILYYKKGSVEDDWIGGQDKGTIIRITKDANKEYKHPTQKPVTLPAHCIKNHKANVVLDLFLGSGSTLIACEQTNRICYGMELDPRYVDVIRKRYAKFIGKEEEWQTITPAI